MKVSRFMAKQYVKPNGWFGRMFTAGMLNRANKQSIFFHLYLWQKQRREHSRWVNTLS